MMRRMVREALTAALAARGLSGVERGSPYRDETWFRLRDGWILVVGPSRGVHVLHGRETGIARKLHPLFVVWVQQRDWAERVAEEAERFMRACSEGRVYVENVVRREACTGEELLADAIADMQRIRKSTPPGEWRLCVGMPNVLVSSLGEFWHMEFHYVLNLFADGEYGALYVVAKRTGGAPKPQAARLVYSTFVRPLAPREGRVRYRDGNPKNIAVSNLYIEEGQGRRAKQRTATRAVGGVVTAHGGTVAADAEPEATAPGVTELGGEAEEWRMFPRSELYEVSNLGHVRRKGSNTLMHVYVHRKYPGGGGSTGLVVVEIRTAKDRGGARHRALRDLSRAVYEAFVGPLASNQVVYHANGDITDNRAVNLRVRPPLRRRGGRPHRDVQLSGPHGSPEASAL